MTLQNAENITTAPGRVCPLRYRYGAAALARAPEKAVPALYVIGGLYGNGPALDAVLALAHTEPVAPTLCFNGDFHWFDVDDGAFADISRRVLAHDAIVGNVEAEFDSPADDAGCGCAYPDSVDSGTVERSNQIHRQLKATARRHPALQQRIAALPMFARYRVADCRVGVVHGDADALAGWGFDVQALDDPEALPALQGAFAAAAVDLFASSHTCLPALRAFALPGGGAGWVANNGAAGMPNFAGELAGLCTRIAATPAPVALAARHEVQVHGAWLSLLPLCYDAPRWQREFLAQWPPGSPAWESYFERITRGPAYTAAMALGRRTG
ncbi:MAG: hypothetical protein Q8K45_14985 [Rubrivivax sp.]|nr:hypothetical protein [Rubrivivax sp.]